MTLQPRTYKPLPASTRIGVSIVNDHDGALWTSFVPSGGLTDEGAERSTLDELRAVSKAARARARRVTIVDEAGFETAVQSLCGVRCLTAWLRRYDRQHD